VIFVKGLRRQFYEEKELGEHGCEYINIPKRGLEVTIIFPSLKRNNFIYQNPIPYFPKNSSNS
jgi:hypothetical protein